MGRLGIGVGLGISAAALAGGGMDMHRRFEDERASDQRNAATAESFLADYDTVHADISGLARQTEMEINDVYQRLGSGCRYLVDRAELDSVDKIEAANDCHLGENLIGDVRLILEGLEKERQSYAGWVETSPHFSPTGLESTADKARVAINDAQDHSVLGDLFESFRDDLAQAPATIAIRVEDGEILRTEAIGNRYDFWPAFFYSFVLIAGATITADSIKDRNTAGTPETATAPAVS